MEKGRELLVVLCLTKYIDTDFQGLRRQEVKQYMEERYGKERVCSVGTYSTLKIKALLKDLARIYNVSIATMNYISKLIEDDWTYEDLFKNSLIKSVLKQFIQENADMISKIPLMLGQPRSKSIHACAVIITPKVMTCASSFPVRSEGAELISEYEGGELENIGFLKEDILGIKQLDKFDSILKSIENRTGEKIDIYNLTLDDEKIYKYFRNGWNGDVFHFGSKGLTEYCKDLKPENIEDLIAAISLYRPGAMENNFHNEYVFRKNGEKEVEYLTGTENITNNTYGLFCVAEDSFIKTIDGSKKIQDISCTDMVLTEDGTYKEVKDKYFNGVKKVVSLISSFGKELLLTEDHKVLTQKGWIEAGKLNKKEHLVKCFYEQNQNNIEFGSIKDWCLGLYLADGCSSGKGTPYIACSSKKFAQKVCDIFNKEFNLLAYPVFHTRCWYAMLSSKRGKGSNSFFSKNYTPNKFKSFLREKDLLGKTKKDKFLPENSNLMTVIGFIEGDGCLSNNTIRIKNSHMALSLYNILQKNNIYSSYYLNKENVDVIKFLDVEEKLKYIIKEKLHKSLLTPVPVDYINTIDLSVLNKRERNNLKATLKKALHTSNYVINKYGGTIEHSLWGKISQITKKGEKGVWDLSVKENHSFVANGIVVHNCYQEQIMSITRELAGFSEEMADSVRKAMGKKKIEVLQALKSQFIEGSMKNSFKKEDMESLWGKMEKASGYLFNRSHAAAYTLTGYVCQWLKVYYPIDYWLTALKEAPEEKIPAYISEIHKTGNINVIGVDINSSEKDLVVSENNITFALLSIKGISDAAINPILEEREKGDFLSFEDFYNRLSFKGSKVNKTAFERLILCGGFDKTDGIKSPKDRLKLIVQYRTISKVKIDKKKDWFEDNSMSWNKNWWWLLQQKKLSGIAFFNFESMISNNFDTYNYIPIHELQNKKYADNRSKVTVGGYVLDIDTREIKKGEMATIQLDSNYDFLYITCFPEQWEVFKPIIENSKKELMIIDGDIGYDKYKKQNVLYINNDSQIKILK